MAAAPFPIPSTYDTLDLYKNLKDGVKVPCSCCRQVCQLRTSETPKLTNTLHTITNSNPEHPHGSSVKYVVPFCSRKCLTEFSRNCVACAPFSLTNTFRVPCLGDSLWMMFSLIPEQMSGENGWVIAQCDDRGNYLYDDRERFVWQWVADSVLRMGVSVPMSN